MGQKKNQKKVVQKLGTITNFDKAIERLNAESLLAYAKKMDRPVKFLRKDTHTGIIIPVEIIPNKQQSKTI